MASWAVARECGKRMEMEQLFVGEVMPLARPDFMHSMLTMPGRRVLVT